jgi:hypothetical protein
MPAADRARYKTVEIPETRNKKTCTAPRGQAVRRELLLVRSLIILLCGFFFFFFFFFQTRSKVVDAALSARPRLILSPPPSIGFKHITGHSSPPSQRPWSISTAWERAASATYMSFRRPATCELSRIQYHTIQYPGLRRQNSIPTQQLQTVCLATTQGKSEAGDGSRVQVPLPQLQPTSR